MRERKKRKDLIAFEKETASKPIYHENNFKR